MGGKWIGPPGIKFYPGTNVCCVGRWRTSYVSKAKGGSAFRWSIQQLIIRVARSVGRFKCKVLTVSLYLGIRVVVIGANSEYVLLVT